jgi:hypothetical protein
MTIKILSEEDLRKRLKKAGKKEKEIEELLTEYTQAVSKATPDTNAMADLLRKNQQNAMLRVKGFNLSREQYDALNNYFRVADSDGTEIDASILVQKALDELIKIIQ